MSHQENQGVTATAVAPFSLDCEINVKLTPGMNLISTSFFKPTGRGELHRSPHRLQTPCKQLAFGGEKAVSQRSCWRGISFTV
jgi:hypothetical protein